MRLTVRDVSCLLPGIVMALVLAGSARAQSQKITEGSCGSLYGAKVCTSYQTRAGQITEFTLRVPVAVIEHTPANAPMTMPPKPDMAVRFAPTVKKQTGFLYANVYWEPHGHPPAAYMVPHFDFHFYFIPERQVNPINCKDMVRPRTVPAGYVLPGLMNVPGMGKDMGMCIPAMGMHAAPAADFNHKTPWKGSLIVGYYGGKTIFFEAMLTKALLLQKHSFSLPVPQGIEPEAHVRYPSEFRAVYLPKSKAYDLTFFY